MSVIITCYHLLGGIIACYHLMSGIIACYHLMSVVIGIQYKIICKNRNFQMKLKQRIELKPINNLKNIIHRLKCMNCPHAFLNYLAIVSGVAHAGHV